MICTKSFFSGEERETEGEGNEDEGRRYILIPSYVSDWFGSLSNCVLMCSVSNF